MSRVDPVMGLATQLIKLWDANNVYDGNQEIHNQLHCWRKALATIVSFTKAESVDGALVQVVLARDIVDDIKAIRVKRAEGDLDECIMQVDRLLWSSMQALRPLAVADSPKLLADFYQYTEAEWIGFYDDWPDRGAASRREKTAGS